MYIPRTVSLFYQKFIVKIHTSDNRSIARWVSPTLKELKRRADKTGARLENPRSTYLEWNYQAELFAFGKRLREEFDQKLLKKALVQREYANLLEFKAKERGLLITERIENNYELVQEGEEIISNYIISEYSKLYPPDIVNALHKYLTSENMLADLGRELGLKDIVATHEFPVCDKTLSDSFKAVVAALKQSKNLNVAENFVKDFVLSQMHNKDIYKIWNPKKPYEYFIELMKERRICDIEPRLCNQSATNTILACFQVGLYSNKKLLGIGWGETVEIAKEMAAIHAIQNVYKNEYRNKN